MIQVRSLSKSYRNRKVLNPLDLKIKKGSITGIVGPNACGKTTLIKCILGLAIPTTGEIWIDGEKIDQSGEFRKKIGYMPQTPSFPNNLCLQELLDMLENLRGQLAPSKQNLIQYFSLNSILHQPLEQLSGGTKQKVAAVIAFMFDAPLVILDEPTVGLDPLSSVLFKELVLTKAQQGTTIVFVSHIMSEIEKMASDIAFINEGDFIFTGSVTDLLKQTKTPTLEKAVIQLFESKKEKSQ